MNRPIHLVGSVPLGSAGEVFDMVGTKLHDLVRRIPDGETGERSIWIRFQTGVLARAANLHKVSERLGGDPWQVTFGITDPQAEVRLPPLGYAGAAKRSYEHFAAAKRSGKIARNTRFQVSLPTPVAVVGVFIDRASQQAFEPLYQAALLRELDEIVSSIPHEELAIQWDVCVEISIIEGKLRYPDESRAGMLARLVKLAQSVPSDVELGFHFCYGDLEHKHTFEPQDLGLCVELSNSLLRGVQRQIHWLHMPIPRDRDDDAYFKPLQGLETRKGTEIYLGLVHATDGLEGGKRRLRTATRYLKGFGIATECGFGRRPPEQIPGLLDLHQSMSNVSAER